MLEKIINQICNEKIEKGLINSSEIKRVEKELTCSIEELKKNKYEDWDKLDELIGEYGALTQNIFFEAGFKSAIGLINELECVRNVKNI